MLVTVFHLMGKQLWICTFDLQDTRVIDLSYTNILASFLVFINQNQNKANILDS